MGQGLLASLQFKEDAGFGGQHVRVDRLVQKVDRTAFITLELPVVLARARRNKNQRDMARALAAANEFCQFKAVHIGHLDVQQRERHIAMGKQ
ncbi:hypothetical protein D3C71_1828610 [compost metagenome]